MTKRTRKSEDAGERSPSSTGIAQSQPIAEVLRLQRQAGNAATAALLLQRQKGRPKLGRGWGDARDDSYNPEEDDAAHDPYDPEEDEGGGGRPNLTFGEVFHLKPARRRKPVKEVRRKAPPVVPGRGPTTSLEDVSAHLAERRAGFTAAFEAHRIFRGQVTTLRGLVNAARLKIDVPDKPSELTPELVGEIIRGYVTAKLYDDRAIQIADGTNTLSNVATALVDMKERTYQPDCPDWQKRRPKLAAMILERVRLDRGQVNADAVEAACDALVRDTAEMAAAKWPVKKIAEATGPKVRRPNVDREWPYGGPNTVPHVHHYGPDSHLKISINQKVERIDLVKAGSPTLRVGEARAAAKGNDTLLAVINELIRLAS